MYKLIVAVLLATLSFSMAFEPSQKPLVTAKGTKPNVLIIMDDSGSMLDHNSKINGKYKVDLMRPVIRNIIERFGPSSYMGLFGLGDGLSARNYQSVPNEQLNGKRLSAKEILAEYIPESIGIRDSEPNGINYSLIAPIMDITYSQQKSKLLELLDIFTVKGNTGGVTNGMSPNPADRIKYYFIAGNTPVPNALYQASLYFRNYPLFLAENQDDPKTPFTYGETDSAGDPLFRLRYRCQTNHIILLTDGEGNRYDIKGYDVAGGLPRKDGSRINLRDIDYSKKPGDLQMFRKIPESAIGTEDIETNRSKTTQTIARIANFIWNKIDLKEYAKEIRGTDDAGKAWDYRGGEDALGITIHGIGFIDPSLADKVKDTMKQQLNAAAFPSGGSVTADASNQTELEKAFNDIFKNIVVIISDGDSLQDQEAISNDILLYRTFFDSVNWSGEVRAYAYDMKEDSFNQGDNFVWSSRETIDSTLLTTLHNEPLISLGLTADQVNWMQGNNVDGFRVRTNVLGDIVNAKMAYHVRDRVAVNVGKFSRAVEKRFFEYTLLKAKHVESNLIVVGSNDGLINFIIAQKGNRSNKASGKRKAAYFPSFFKDKIPELMDNDYDHFFMVDGQSVLFDAFIKSKGTADSGRFKTLGLTAMGAGGAGIVGYELFSTLEDGTGYSNNITFNFEITDKPGGGFEDLGYTYSGFEFINQSDGNENRAVTIFGNGFGKNNSVVYVVNAQNGNKITQINLGSTKGAGSPSVIVEKDPKSGFHKMVRLYVGDYEGNMHRVDFQDSYDIKVAKVNNRDSQIIFKANNSQPIAARPATAKVKGKRWVYFGTGMAASAEDVDPKYFVDHYFYAVIDEGSKGTLKLDDLDVIQEETHREQMPAIPETYGVYTSNKIQVGYDLKNGWAFSLKGKGGVTGERIIHPIGISRNKNIHFVTWAVNPGEPDDPCLPSTDYGQRLYLDMATGNSAHVDKTINKSGMFNSENSYGVDSGTFMDVFGSDSGGGSGYRNQYTVKDAELLGFGKDSSISSLDNLDQSYNSETHSIDNKLTGADTDDGNDKISDGDDFLFKKEDEKIGRLYLQRHY